jgi:hypothetical protein
LNDPIEFQGNCSNLPFRTEMKEAEKNAREYLAEDGKRGGLASRRELTRSHARQMVAIREAKRAAVKAGKPWPPRDRKSLKLLKLS